ncbi:BURP domain-containing protein, partial [Psidium guajava]
IQVASAAPAADASPFTPKAYLVRYWNRHVANDLPKPPFLLSKASPLTAADAVAFAKLAARGAISAHLPSFCAAARLVCFPELPSATRGRHDRDSDFATYSNKNFTTYGANRVGGRDSFKGYAVDQNLPVSSFRRYSRGSKLHRDEFSVYGAEGNVADQSFNSYGAGSTGGHGEFVEYNKDVNIANLKFNNYGSSGEGRSHSFSGYTEATNAGDETFATYGKGGNRAPNEFTAYATESNHVGSGFNGYSQGVDGANNSFTSYGVDGNNPQNIFKSYDNGGNGAVESFKTYRERANSGDDSFTSYAKGSNQAEVNFANYGKSFNEGTDKFTVYGGGAPEQAVGFKVYGVNNTFQAYGKNAVATFSRYTNRTTSSTKVDAIAAVDGKNVNRWVEPGKFFRESMLKTGTVMPMPDIRDKMPRRSFLPRSIASKLPFSTTKLGELKQIFHAGENSTMEKIMADALGECERAPSRGESKQCVSSIEDMIDFATSVLGRNVAVRSTESVEGSNREILIGQVKGINGGRVTKSVSCHQSLFPYLLYYCHSVPKVRVYEADILDPKLKAKINHGVAICHLDTSAWSAGHGAFLALGSSPGQIEVCHWIFENDMNWAVAD